MSAYMVSNETLSGLANLIYRYYASQGEAFGIHFPEELSEELGEDVYYARRIFKALADLNIESIKQRYVDDYEDMLGEVKFIPDYDFHQLTVYGPGFGRIIMKPWHYQVLKSLDCYLYQSCEGQCFKHPLYIAIERLRDRWGLYIATNQPEYELADWD